MSPEAWGVCGWVSPSGVEAALAFALFRGGIVGKDEVERWSERRTGKESRERAAGTMAAGARVRVVGLRSRGQLWRHAPPQLTAHSSHLHTSTAMDGEALVDNVFSSGQLWRQSSLFADSDPYESTLFAPLQLDSEFGACLRPERVP